MSALDCQTVLSEYLDGDQNEYGRDFCSDQVFRVQLQLVLLLQNGWMNFLIIIKRKCLPRSSRK